jgi:hypothetical protein
MSYLMTTSWDAKTPIGRSNLSGCFAGNRAFNGLIFPDFRSIGADLGQTHAERFLNAPAAVPPPYAASIRSLSVPAVADRVRLDYSWKTEFTNPMFLVPPNNTGYMPLWSFERNEVEAENVQKNLLLGRTQGVTVWRPHPSTRRDDPFNVRKKSVM